MDQIPWPLRLPAVDWSPILLLAAYWIVAHLARRRAPREGLPAEVVGDLSFWLAAGALVSGRLIYVLPDWTIYLRHPLDLLRIQAGLSFYGGLAGAVLAGWWYTRGAHLPFWKVADLYATYLPLGIAIRRLGCLVADGCYGRLATPPLGVAFPGMSQPRHPAELYEAALALAIFGLLLWARHHKAFAGQILLLFLATYPPARALVDVFRISLEPSWISSDQVISAAIVVAAVSAWWWRARQANRESERLTSLRVEGGRACSDTLE